MVTWNRHLDGNDPMFDENVEKKMSSYEVLLRVRCSDSYTAI